MERRSFLKMIIGGVAAVAAVQSFPFRVYSFPSEIVAPTLPTIAEGAIWTGPNQLLTIQMITKEDLGILENERTLERKFDQCFRKNVVKIGTVLNLRNPNAVELYAH